MDFTLLTYLHTYTCFMFFKNCFIQCVYHSVLLLHILVMLLSVSAIVSVKYYIVAICCSVYIILEVGCLVITKYYCVLVFISWKFCFKQQLSSFLPEVILLWKHTNDFIWDIRVFVFVIVHMCTGRLLGICIIIVVLLNLLFIIIMMMMMMIIIIIIIKSASPSCYPSWLQIDSCDLDPI